MVKRRRKWEARQEEEYKMKMIMNDKQNPCGIEEKHPEPPMALTVEDLMRELHISRNTAYALTEKEGFPVFHIGKRKLINRGKLQEWMDRQTSGVA